VATKAELDNRGWKNKSWKARKRTLRGGSPFTKATRFRLLFNVTYIGKLGYKDEVNEGEHAAIISPEVWQKVQSPPGEMQCLLWCLRVRRGSSEQDAKNFWSLTAEYSNFFGVA
jgi:hypothetical protein